MSECVAYEFGRFSDADLAHQTGAVGFDRLGTDIQVGRDLLGGEPLGDQVQYFALAA